MGGVQTGLTRGPSWPEQIQPEGHRTLSPNVSPHLFVTVASLAAILSIESELWTQSNLPLISLGLLGGLGCQGSAVADEFSNCPLWVFQDLPS